jgi:hypothetical protein
VHDSPGAAIVPRKSQNIGSRFFIAANRYKLWLISLALSPGKN